MNQVAETFHQAAELNRSDALRKGNVITIPSGMDVIIAGDIHGNRPNLTKVIALADLSRTPDHYLVLQEIIHGPVDERIGQDRSVELLLRAARLKVAHPAQVGFVMGNHDLAQATGSEITKGGRGSCRMFTEGVRHLFADDADKVLEAVDDFLLSMPLAVRCPNGVVVIHSVPSPGREEMAGMEIFHRPYVEEDFHREGAAYEWLWGRRQTPELVEKLAKRLKAEFLVLGHHHVESGCEFIGKHAMVMVSDHSRGYILHLLSDEPAAPENVQKWLKKIAVLKTTNNFK